MKRANWIALGLFVAAALAAGAVPAKTPQERGSATFANPKKVPVIVELFTSEGCSSCPPADALLSRLQAEQPIPGAEVIAIEEHVDYWDQQGWRDPFSSPEWTERQRDYAEVLPDHGVYTPQMVIDGSTGLVGSRAEESGQRIEEAATRAKVPVTVAIGPAEKKNRAEIQVQVGPLAAADNPKDYMEVWLAIIESGLHSAVKGGENDGRDLYHAPVLRKLQKLGVAFHGTERGFAGTTSVSLDRKRNTGNLRVVAFVQERRSKRVLGAASEAFRPAP